MAGVIRIGLVADDLTGACDSSLPFLAGGPVLVGLWPYVPDQPGRLACAAVTTESRAEQASTARTRSRLAAGRLRFDLLYRKLDSMLRGHPAADLAASLDIVGGRCLVAPALPGEGRTTVGGIQRWPGGQSDLRRMLACLDARVEPRDAVTDADLDRVAREALARGDRLLAGSAGLAAALARALGLAPPPRPPALACAHPLAVVGSRAAVAQATFARARGWEVQEVGPGELPVLRGHDALVLTGGETAARVLGHTGTEVLELVGEALPLTPLARVRGGRLDGLPVVLTRPG